MESRISFGKIHIIEWLWKVNPKTGQPDRRTGRETYSELIALLAATGSRMQVVLHRVGSRAAFLSRLKRIEQDFHASRKVPLLQIETHGDDDGIGLTDEDGLSWPELMKALTPLNMATGLRLSVVLASCHGIWGIKMAQPIERAPFLALLGPNRQVSPGEVVRGMRAFYRGVFEHNDGNRAMRMLNEIVDPDKITFGIFNCEKLFIDVWNAYLDETSKAGAAEARVEKMMARGRAEYGPRPPEDSERARAMMFDYITDHPGHFENSKRHFFLIDLYPENTARFNVLITPVEPEPQTVGM
jgi:hypothetical protein